jgi:hypothetical protein
MINLRKFFARFYPEYTIYRDFSKEENMEDIRPIPVIHRIYTKHTNTKENYSGLLGNDFERRAEFP